eukprot:sb/3464272/
MCFLPSPSLPSSYRVCAGPGTSPRIIWSWRPSDTAYHPASVHLPKPLLLQSSAPSTTTQSDSSGGGEGEGESCSTLDKLRALPPLSDKLLLLLRDARTETGTKTKEQQINTYLDTCVAATETVINNDSLDLYLKLREANEMCRVIKKDLMFSREVIPMDSRSDVFVRATDFAHNRATIWSYDTFLDRFDKLTARYCAVQAGEKEGGDIPMSELFDSTEVWERDMSVLGDTISTSGGSDHTFLSTTSVLNFSTSSSQGSKSDCPLLHLLQRGCTTSIPRITGNSSCDSILDSVSNINSTLSLLGSQAIRSGASVSKVTYLVTCLHNTVTTWNPASSNNHKMSQTTMDLVSLLSNTLRHLSDSRITADLPKLQDYLLDIVYQAGRECTCSFIKTPSAATVSDAANTSTLAPSTPGIKITPLIMGWPTNHEPTMRLRSWGISDNQTNPQFLPCPPASSPQSPSVQIIDTLITCFLFIINTKF